MRRLPLAAALLAVRPSGRLLARCPNDAPQPLFARARAARAQLGR